MVVEARDHGQHGGLSAARVSDQGDELSFLQVEAEVAHDAHFFAVLGKALPELKNLEELVHVPNSVLGSAARRLILPLVRISLTR